MPGVVLPPVQRGQVGTQPCAQVVEEDHVERDAHKGIEDTEHLPCLCAGCQVSVACGARKCYRSGEGRESPGLAPTHPTPRSSRGLSPSPGGGGEAPHSCGHSPCSLIQQSVLKECSSPKTLPPGSPPGCRSLPPCQAWFPEMFHVISN